MNTLLNIAVIALPVLAILFTSINHQTTITLLIVWFPQLLKGTGNNVLYALFGYEIEFYIFVILLLKTSYCIEFTIQSLCLWLVVILVSSLTIQFKKQYKENLQLTKRLLLILFFVLTNGLRILILYANNYNDDQEWYKDENTNDSNLDVIMISLETALICWICYRKTIAVQEKDILTKYTSVYWLYILLNLSQVWIVDIKVCFVILLQAFGLTLFLPYIQGHVENKYYPIESQFTQLYNVLVSCLSSIPVYAVIYVIVGSYTMYVCDQVFFESTLKYSNNQQVCDLYDPIQTDWYAFKKFISDNNLPYINNLLDLFELKIDLQLDYDVFEMSCYGQNIAYLPTDNILSLITLFVGSLPIIFLVGHSFPECKKLISLHLFWIGVTFLNLLGLLCTQFGDIANLFIYVLHDSVYTRAYSSIGLGVLFCQIIMVLISLRLWYYTFNPATDARKRASWAETLSQATTYIMLASLIYTIYSITVSSPITDYGFKHTVKDYTSQIQPSSVNSLLDLQLQPQLDFYKAGLIDSLANECFNDISNPAVYVTAIMNQLTNDLKSSTINQINLYPNSTIFNQMLASPPISYKDIEYLDESLWGSENLSIPTIIVIISTLYGITIITTSILSKYYKLKALYFVDIFFSVFLIAFVISMLVLSLQFYIYVLLLGYTPYIIWDKVGAALLGATVLSFCIGKLFSVL